MRLHILSFDRTYPLMKTCHLELVHIKRLTISNRLNTEIPDLMPTNDANSKRKTPTTMNTTTNRPYDCNNVNQFLECLFDSLFRDYVLSILALYLLH